MSSLTICHLGVQFAHNANSNGDCLLCDASQQIVIQEFDKFLWISSISPYWKFNTMVIPKRHVEQFHQFTTEELTDLQEITEYVTEQYIRLDYHRGDEHPAHDNVIFFWRFRDPARNVKKTAHLHLYVVPNPDQIFGPVGCPYITVRSIL